MYDFGLRLKQLRLDRNLTQQQVAKRLNLHKSSIYGYEANVRMPSCDILSKLALFYNVTTDYLLGHDNRTIISIDNLTNQQKEILTLLIIEFKSTQK